MADRAELNMAIGTLGRGQASNLYCDIGGCTFAGSTKGRVFLGERAGDSVEGTRLELEDEATWREVALPPLAALRFEPHSCASCQGGGMMSHGCDACEHTHDAVCPDCDGTGRSGLLDADESSVDGTVWIEAFNPLLSCAVNARLVCAAVGWARPERVHIAGARVVIRNITDSRVAIVAAYAVLL